MTHSTSGFIFTGVMLSALALLLGAGTNASGAWHFLGKSLYAQRLPAVGVIMVGVALPVRS